MKLSQKILSLILIVTVLLIPSFRSFAQQSTEENALKELNLLDELGLLPTDFKENYSSGRQLTRGEFASLISCVVNAEKMTDPSDISIEFNDVSTSNTHYQAINMVCSLGYMNGSNGSFNPDDKILYHQVFKVLISILGYDELAVMKGGYPYGYLTQADTLGLTDGVEYKTNSKITSASIITALYNMLNTRVLVIDSITNDSYTLSSQDGTSFLESFHKIKTVSGQVRAVPGKMLIDTDPLEVNQVIIDSYLYKTVSSKSFLAYFGCLVNAYINSDNYVIALCDLPYGGRSYTISFEDIELFDYTAIEYYEGDSLKKITISDSADIIYNGKPDYLSNPASVLSLDGAVEIIYSDDENEADVVCITVVENYVVKKADYVTKTIYDMYSGKSLCIEDLDYYNFYDSFGNNMTFEELSPYDVVSVVQSKDLLLTTLYYSNREIEGKITAIQNNGSEYVIAGKAFKVAGSFAENMQTYTIGDSGIFPLDIYGSIAAFKSYSDSWQYGYLIASHVNEGLESNASVILMNDSGILCTYELADKVLIDSVTYEAVHGLKNSIGIGTDVGQIIRYYTVDDKLKAIDTLSTVSGSSQDSLVSMYSGYNNNNEGVSELMFNTYQKILGSKVAMNSETKVFFVPPKYSANKNNYSVDDYSYFINDRTYYVNAYACGDNPHVADVALIFGGGASSSISIRSPFIVVENVTEAISKEGESGYKIHGVVDGNRAEFFVPDTSVIDNIKSLSDSSSNHKLGCGDIIKVASDSNGYVTAVTLYYEYSADTLLENIPVGTTLARGARTLKANVYSEKDGVMCVTQNALIGSGIELTVDEIEVLKPNLYDIYIVNKKARNPVIDITTTASIVDYKSVGADYSQIVICATYNNPGIILIK